jgi:adenylate cyclase
VRFRSFRLRLLVAMVALIGVAQLAGFLVVARIHRSTAETEMQGQLEGATNQLVRVVTRRNNDLARAASGLTFDAGLRAAMATTRDRETLRSALTSFRTRVDADLVALLSLDGELLAETRVGPSAIDRYQILQKRADQSESARAIGYAIVDGTVHSLVVVPLQAPDIVAWIVVGFRLDDAFVAMLKRETGVGISLARDGKTLAATTAKPKNSAEAHRRLGLVDGAAVDLTLWYSRDEKLEPARAVERELWIVFASSVALAALVALVISRGVTEPVRLLAGFTRRIARGEYAARLTLRRADELGQLADAFNTMAAGLEERDRIRDLLEKNVSPEIAAQLLRDGGALGGEEREVTILFADLRGFTSLCEGLAPPALLALLNRYLDAMSAEIEQRGGVIDKFIGDAIMAIFGAPVPCSDAADRALTAALGMLAALDRLNRELAAEARPPLAFGIGINTARVVAGNIGSRRRLNYSVIGDGVNVAARLQSLTRTAAYDATIITSQATVAALRTREAYSLHALGNVEVKGRKEPVTVYRAG